MVSYAEQFRSLFPKKKQKKKDEIVSDDEEVIYIKNPNKYSMIDLSDWFNIQQKQLERYKISPPDKSLRNCEMIIHNESNDNKTKGPSSYESSPLNELFPLNRFVSEKDVIKHQVVESELKKDSNEHISSNNDKENINTNEAIGDISNNQQGVQKEEGEDNINNETHKSINDEINMKMNHKWYKDKSKENEKQNKDSSLEKNQTINNEIKTDCLFNDRELNITKNQMEDFHLEVKKIESQINKKNNKLNEQIRKSKPIRHKKPKRKAISNPFLLNNNTKKSQYKGSSLLENDDAQNRFSTQIILNDSNLPSSIKFAQDNYKESNRDFQSLNYDSSFSTQIPYQIPFIDPIYHYGEFATEPLIKRIKLIKQQTMLNIMHSNQISIRENEQYKNTLNPISKNRTRLIKQKRASDVHLISKRKKELLYYQELKEKLNKLNEEYIARYRKLHPKEKEEKQRNNSTMNNQKRINNYVYNQSTILPPIQKPISHSASQDYYRKINIGKSNDDLHHFLSNHKLKELFGNYQTFNSKIAQVRSFLKK